MLEGIKTIFFDYDGTIHDSIHIYTPALNSAYQFLVDQGLAESKVWKNEELIHWLGYNSKDMWKEFMPHLDETLREQASKIVGAEMMKQIENGHAKLYEGALEVLSYLKTKGYTLVFISNCNTYYKEIHRKQFGLDQYFTRMIGSQEYDYQAKSEILKIVKDEFPAEWCIVGDRNHDINAGKLNNIKTIGCLYGFGTEDELASADYKINDIKALKSYF